MADATSEEYSDDYDEEDECEECSEEGEDSDESDEELDEDEEEEEEEGESEEEEEEPLPRDLSDVPCCSREVEDEWMRPREGEVPRCVVIDGANVVHTGSAYSKERKDPMLDIASLLAWIRFFLVNDFEVVTVLPQRYLRKTLVLHTDILKSLNQLGLLFVPHSLGNISDDYIVLELARQFEGVVLSVDQYRDQCRLHPSIARMAREQRVAPAFREGGEELGEEEWFHRTHDGRHWLAYHTLEFAERRSIGEEEWRAKFFSTRGLTHELVVEQRERWSEEKRRRRMELVDGAIRARVQRPPAYKDVITRAEMAAKLKEEAEEEERREKGHDELDRVRREERAKLRAERRRREKRPTEVITRSEMAVKLKEEAEEEERREKEHDELDRVRREERAKVRVERRQRKKRPTEVITRAEMAAKLKEEAEEEERREREYAEVDRLRREERAKLRVERKQRENRPTEVMITRSEMALNLEGEAEEEERREKEYAEIDRLRREERVKVRAARRQKEKWMDTVD